MEANMSSSLIVPVVDVHNENFKEVWPTLIDAIKTSSFIALDTVSVHELSGLGNRKALLAESIEDRYKAICHAARSRSILSLGIACFKKLYEKASDSYLVQVFNLTLLCSEEYIIEPQSVQFLVQHGFDFNKQYSLGVPYVKGNSKGGTDDRGIHIRALFTELLRARKPLVLHNGLIDIAFLYQSFYAQLPDRLVTFTADLSEMFPAGIYDTKYVIEFEIRLAASYLEYAYKRCNLDNSRSVAAYEMGPHVYIEFSQYVDHMSAYVEYRECSAVAASEGPTVICQPFSAYGWCSNGANCPLSHDTDLIILQDEKSKEDSRKKRKRQRQREKKKGAKENPDAASVADGAPESKKPNMEVSEAAGEPQDAMAVIIPGLEPQSASGQYEAQTPPVQGEGNGAYQAEPALAMAVGDGAGGLGDSLALPEGQRKKAETGTHRAGFDAYMTGFIFAHSCALKQKEAAAVETADKEPSWIPGCLNKIYLSGKAAPLNVVKSTFAKSCKAHVQKMELVWGRKL
ncbi:unnamed protein product [Menidia menidia]|uniref:Target of EGR1 protein 1 n=1 Tax=Menidia menidia TaxID=238744 RepID=A0A8S4AW37_9TELE|nr:unnamed protein product [Menidia menidia]